MEILKAQVVEALRTHFIGRNEPTVAWGRAVSNYLQLPGLRSYYTGGAIRRDASGTPYLVDLVGGIDLSRNSGTVTLQISTLNPAIWLDGSTGYWYYTDYSHFNITGTESEVYTNHQGLTVGCWVAPNSLTGGTSRGLISKYYSSGSNKQYLLYLYAGTDRFRYMQSNDGSTSTGIVDSTVSVSTNNWYFVVGRFSPYYDLTSIYVNGTKDTTTGVTTTIQATNTAGNFELGRTEQSNSFCFNGYMCHMFVCAEYVLDKTIEALYQSTRKMFGV